jgi:hypothetical protein
MAVSAGKKHPSQLDALARRPQPRMAKLLHHPVAQIGTRLHCVLHLPGAPFFNRSCILI